MCGGKCQNVLRNEVTQQLRLLCSARVNLRSIYVRRTNCQYVCVYVCLCCVVQGAFDEPPRHFMNFSVDTIQVHSKYTQTQCKYTSRIFRPNASTHVHSKYTRTQYKYTRSIQVHSKYTRTQSKYTPSILEVTTRCCNFPAEQEREDLELGNSSGTAWKETTTM